MSSTDGQGLTWNAISADNNSSGRIVNFTTPVRTPLPLLRPHGSPIAPPHQATPAALVPSPLMPHASCQEKTQPDSRPQPTARDCDDSASAAVTSPAGNISDRAAPGPS